MPVPDNAPRSPDWFDRLTKSIASGSPFRVNRRLLGGIGAATVVSGVSAIGMRGPARAQEASSLSALNAAATIEGLMVVLLGLGRSRSSEMALDETTIRLLRAAQCEEEAHYNNIVSYGGAPETGRYTIADQILTDATSFLSTWIDLEHMMVGMYMAGARQVAANGDLDMVELMYQIGTVESQHLAVLRQLGGERLPIDRAFPTWQFREAVEAVERLGAMEFIDGPATAYDYPGPGERYCRGVTGLVAETTSQQTRPDVTAAPDRNATPDGDRPNATPVQDE